MKLLLVEDTASLARSVARGLREEGFVVELADNGEDGLHLGSEAPFDLIILDRMLPKLDGLRVLHALRARGVRTPVLMLTALGEVHDRVAGLDGGADDYLVKPFAFEELLARVRALVRREHGQASNVVRIGRLVVDLSARRAHVDDHPLPLTAHELALLELLVLHPGVPQSRTAITECLYDEGSERDSNVIDVFVARLRKKLDAAGLVGAQVVRTQRGEGFVLDVAALAERGR
jgi:DNA-binding response OmpR family regulator